MGRKKCLSTLLTNRWDVKVPENAVGEYYNQLLVRYIGKRMDELTKEMPVCELSEDVIDSLYFQVHIGLLQPKYIS